MSKETVTFFRLTSVKSNCWPVNTVNTQPLVDFAQAFSAINYRVNFQLAPSQHLINEGLHSYKTPDYPSLRSLAFDSPIKLSAFTLPVPLNVPLLTLINVYGSLSIKRRHSTVSNGLWELTSRHTFAGFITHVIKIQTRQVFCLTI